MGPKGTGEAARHGGRSTFVYLETFVGGFFGQVLLPFRGQSTGKVITTELQDIPGLGSKHLAVQILNLVRVSHWETHVAKDVRQAVKHK